MTNPQLTAAKRAKGASAGGIGLGLAALLVRGGSGESGRRFAGRIEELVDGAERAEVVVEEDSSRGRKDARTLEET